METTKKKEIEQANEVIAEMLLDVLYQACAIQEESDNEFIENGEPFIDKCCISAYEQACNLLTNKGYLRTKNGRIYFLTEKAKKLK